MRITSTGLASAATAALAAALIGAAPHAGAATSASSVLITSFSYSASAGLLSWADPYQSFAASALEAGGLLGASTESFETDDYLPAIAGGNTAHASAAASTTTAQTFWATASTSSSLGAAFQMPHQANATVGQSGTFRLSTPGTVTFVVGYQLNVAATQGNAVTDYGSALLAFNLSDADGSSGGQASDALQSFAQASGSGARNGRFTFTVDLSTGEAGFYTLSGSAIAFSSASAVPEPQTWLLMAGGALVLALRTRRSVRR